MYQKSAQYLKRLRCVLGYGAAAQFVLFGFRKNRASYSARSSLIHSYGYESAGDRADYLALFPLNSEPFMNYPGQWPARARVLCYEFFIAFNFRGFTKIIFPVFDST
jgi:hypothetical protein